MLHWPCLPGINPIFSKKKKGGGVLNSVFCAEYEDEISKKTWWAGWSACQGERPAMFDATKSPGKWRQKWLIILAMWWLLLHYNYNRPLKWSVSVVWLLMPSELFVLSPVLMERSHGERGQTAGTAQWVRNENVGTGVCTWRKESLLGYRAGRVFFLLSSLWNDMWKIRFHLHCLGNLISCFHLCLTGSAVL